jgi:hypothetical protein
MIKSMPSPLHRDPETDGDDYGCFSDGANREVARVVAEAIEGIGSGTLDDQDAIVDFVRRRLRAIGSGATDTIVKENVFQALWPAIEEAGIAFDHMVIYGW